MKLDILRLGAVLVVVCSLPQRIQSLNPSPGCGRAMPWPPNPGRRHQFQINYHDQFLGPMPRQYRIQLPNGKCVENCVKNYLMLLIFLFFRIFNEQSWTRPNGCRPTSLNRKLKRSTGTMHTQLCIKQLWGLRIMGQNPQDHSPWHQVGLVNNILMLWPGGNDDGLDGRGSFNCSKTEGPMGLTCDPELRAKTGDTFCYPSCPLCDPLNSCDWSSCADDIGFVKYIMEEVTGQW